MGHLRDSHDPDGIVWHVLWHVSWHVFAHDFLDDFRLNRFNSFHHVSSCFITCISLLILLILLGMLMHVDVAHLHMDRIPLVLCPQGIEVHNVHLNARVEALAHGPC